MVDAAIKEGLLYEFKKFSNSVHVKIYGNSRDRSALIRFSRLVFIVYRNYS